VSLVCQSSGFDGLRRFKGLSLFSDLGLNSGRIGETPFAPRTGEMGIAALFASTSAMGCGALPLMCVPRKAQP